MLNLQTLAHYDLREIPSALKGKLIQGFRRFHIYMKINNKLLSVSRYVVLVSDFINLEFSVV